MAFLYNQPIAHRFGTTLTQLIESGDWHTFEAAVAWVRRSGTQHLLPTLVEFLRKGGVARFTVGIDIENTSQEGLQDLLYLGSVGAAETFVYHNEFDSSFHPKVYLFSANGLARLIVGSNNLTESGLFTNTEAGLQLDAGLTDPVIVEALTALASWRDTSEHLAKQLDDVLLKDLVRRGYVFPERALRRRRSESESKKVTRHKDVPALFGSKRITAPSPPVTGRVHDTQVGRVLLMRVRRASETERRTQVQFPIRLVRTQFFENVGEITSAHDGRSHRILAASARGGINTLKVEIPEIDSMKDPVLRLERTSSAVIYRAYDSKSILGHPIMDALQLGIDMKATVLTVPGQPARSTMYRFI